MSLGNCRACEAPLVVSHQHKQDRQGRLLAPDGMPAPLSEGGAPMGPLATHWVVCCGECHLPVPDHPHQKELDDAAAARRRREEEAAKRPQAPMPYLPVAPEPFGPIEAQVRAVQQENALLRKQLEHLEARVASMETKRRTA